MVPRAQRRVARQHQDVLVPRNGFPCALDGVSRAALLGLLHKANPVDSIAARTCSAWWPITA